MNTLQWASYSGGLLTWLVFFHFLVDWVFQTHKEAMAKHNHAWVRAGHCAIYTVGFMPFLVLWLQVSFGRLLFIAAILFLSHFFEDTYYPVYLWAKYIRRPPQLQYKFVRSSQADHWCMSCPNAADKSPTHWESILYELNSGSISLEAAQKKLDMDGFIDFVDGTLGKILMIAIDQIIHIAFLIPVVFIVIGW